MGAFTEDINKYSIEEIYAHSDKVWIWAQLRNGIYPTFESMGLVR